jgi:signal transduction histidine kinase
MIEFRETAFMGRITAGVTHEMKNVLAIIKESAGLMEDLLFLSQDGSFKHQEKFFRVLSKIGDQVSRGVELSTTLNRFAHSPDLTSAEVDLGETIGDVVFLSRRFAHVKGITLKVVPQGRPVMLLTDSLKLQMVVFGCIDLIMDLMGAGTDLYIRPVENAYRGVFIEFYSHGVKTENFPLPSSAPQWPALFRSAHDLRATIEPCEPPSWFRLVIDQNR